MIYEKKWHVDFYKLHLKQQHFYLFYNNTSTSSTTPEAHERTFQNHTFGDN
jgi:hypothetical protein